MKDFAFDVWDYATNPKKLLSKIISSLGLKLPEIPAAFGELAKGAFNKVKSSAVGFLKKHLDDSGGDSGAEKKQQET
ncbi:hypothetical protein QNN00_14565 [Bacillus velezensis]|nr:hypothetical protein [Bacillus velezensis]